MPRAWVDKNGWVQEGLYLERERVSIHIIACHLCLNINVTDKTEMLLNAPIGGSEIHNNNE